MPNHLRDTVLNKVGSGALPVAIFFQAIEEASVKEDLVILALEFWELFNLKVGWVFLVRLDSCISQHQLSSPIIHQPPSQQVCRVYHWPLQSHPRLLIQIDCHSKSIWESQFCHAQVLYLQTCNWGTSMHGNGQYSNLVTMDRNPEILYSGKHIIKFTVIRFQGGCILSLRL